MLSDRIKITNKIHTATAAGRPGQVTDENGRKVQATCGQRSAKYLPAYEAAETPVICQKCLVD